MRNTVCASRLLWTVAADMIYCFDLLAAFLLGSMLIRLRVQADPVPFTVASRSTGACYLLSGLDAASSLRTVAPRASFSLLPCCLSGTASAAEHCASEQGDVNRYLKKLRRCGLV